MQKKGSADSSRSPSVRMKRNGNRYLIQLTLPLLLFLVTTATEAQTTRKRVVMISIDGTPDFLIDKYLKNGVLSPDGAFATMKKKGAFAGKVFPVNVASTGPSHISIFTGASPGTTGIVGNSFRKTDQQWESPSLTAFRQSFSAETIFQAAMRQGKKVMAFGGVGLDYLSETRKTDYLHMYPIFAGPSLVIDLIRTDTVYTDHNGKAFIKLRAESNSPSPAVIGLTGNVKIPLNIYLTDSALNEANILRHLPQLIIDTDTDLTNGSIASVIPDKWISLVLEKNARTYNTSFRIFKVDDSPGSIRLYMTAPVEVFGNPSGFLKKIQAACGLWPGEPDNGKQTTGLVSTEIWFEQLDRLAKYSRDMILTGLKEKDWDLMFGYFSTLDDVQHRYTLTDPRQVDYKADNGQRPRIYAGYIEKRFQTIDRYLMEIMKAAPAGTNFIIFSDHGMVPIHTCLLLGNYLKKEGYQHFEEEIVSVSSGNSAHVYLNRERIKPDQYAAYLEQLRQKLKSLKDEKTGEAIFELVADREEQKKYGLFNKEYSGDLFVSCRPGYSVFDRYQPGVNYLVHNSFDPEMFANENEATRKFLLNGTMNQTGRAVHGCLGTLREGQSIFYSWGPGIPKRKVDKVFSIQIAATVAKLLEIQPPFAAEGNSIF